MSKEAQLKSCDYGFKKKKSLVWILRLNVCVCMYKNNRRKYSGNSHTDKLITSKNMYSVFLSLIECYLLSGHY